MPDIGYLETEARTSTNYFLALLHSTARVRASTSLCLPSAMPKLPTGVNVDIIALLIDISLISNWFSTLQLKGWLRLQFRSAVTVSQICLLFISSHISQRSFSCTASVSPKFRPSSWLLQCSAGRKAPGILPCRWLSTKLSSSDNKSKVS